jgi:hypothetical protein
MQELITIIKKELAFANDRNIKLSDVSSLKLQLNPEYRYNYINIDKNGDEHSLVSKFFGWNRENERLKQLDLMGMKKTDLTPPDEEGKFILKTNSNPVNINDYDYVVEERREFIVKGEVEKQYYNAFIYDLTDNSI